MGFKAMTSAIPGKCSDQQSHEATQIWTDQFVKLMCSHPKNDELMKCLHSVVETWI